MPVSYSVSLCVYVMLRSDEQDADVLSSFLTVDKQTYVLTIAPGVDASLLLAICVCLDEAANDQG